MGDSMMTKVRRLWRRAQPYRDRFGFLAGNRLAWEMTLVEYRRAAGELVAMHVPGLSQPVYLRAGSSDGEVLRQMLVVDALELPLDPAPRRIIDGGANFGLASLSFVQRWPDAEIVAVELEAANLALAKKNCAHLSQITLRHAALWGSSGMVGISDPEAEAHSFRASEAAGGTIPAIRVGELLDSLGWETVDLVKLDIEGAERSVLADGASWLPRTRHLLVELHDRFEPGCTHAFSAAIDPALWEVREVGEYLLASRKIA